MERLAQYWDDVDDLIGIVGLCAEGIRCLVFFALYAMLFVTTVGGGILVALNDPPMALAIVTVLLVLLMYRSVTAAISPPAPA